MAEVLEIDDFDDSTENLVLSTTYEKEQKTSKPSRQLAPTPSPPQKDRRAPLRSMNKVSPVAAKNKKSGRTGEYLEVRAMTPTPSEPEKPQKSIGAASSDLQALEIEDIENFSDGIMSPTAPVERSSHQRLLDTEKTVSKVSLKKALKLDMSSASKAGLDLKKGGDTGAKQGDAVVPFVDDARSPPPAAPKVARLRVTDDHSAPPVAHRGSRNPLSESMNSNAMKLVEFEDGIRSPSPVPIVSAGRSRVATPQDVKRPKSFLPSDSAGGNSQPAPLNSKSKLTSGTGNVVLFDAVEEL